MTSDRDTRVDQLGAEVLDMTPEVHEGAAARLLVDRNNYPRPADALLAALVHLQFAAIKRDRARWDHRS